MSRNVRGTRIPVFTLGERIRKAREDLGLSQQAFADMLGVDRKTVSNWEGGRNHPRYGDLMLIASTTDVSLEWLAAEEFRPTVAVVVGGAVDNAKGSRRDTREDHDLLAAA